MTFRGMIKSVTAAALLTVGAVGTAAASDDVSFWYDRTGPGSGGTNYDSKHLLQFFELGYTNIGGTEKLHATLDFKPEIVKGHRKGGFWLVVSDGPNPKNRVDEYAILYADLTNNRISAFQYNGNNSANSITTPGNQLEVFNDAMTFDPNFNTSDGVISFDLDVTSINALDIGTEGKWDGIQFGEKIGVWFHFGENIWTSYGPGQNPGQDTQLESFAFRKNDSKPDNQGWVDFSNKHTEGGLCADYPDKKGCPPTEVSEPGTLAVLGMGLIGLAAVRRRKHAA